LRLSAALTEITALILNITWAWSISGAEKAAAGISDHIPIKRRKLE
jgi:hypothetical protein